jgi:hypothetical protein
MMDEYFLVNVVHNDFQDRDAIFRPFLADAGLKVNGDDPTPKANGDTPVLNGFKAVNGDAQAKAVKA